MIIIIIIFSIGNHWKINPEEHFKTFWASEPSDQLTSRWNSSQPSKQPEGTASVCLGCKGGDPSRASFKDKRAIATKNRSQKIAFISSLDCIWSVELIIMEFLLCVEHSRHFCLWTPLSLLIILSGLLLFIDKAGVLRTPEIVEAASGSTRIKLLTLSPSPRVVSVCLLRSFIECGSQSNSGSWELVWNAILGCCRRPTKSETRSWSGNLGIIKATWKWTMIKGESDCEASRKEGGGRINRKSGFWIRWAQLARENTVWPLEHLGWENKEAFKEWWWQVRRMKKSVWTRSHWPNQESLEYWKNKIK